LHSLVNFEITLSLVDVRPPTHPPHAETPQLVCGIV